MSNPVDHLADLTALRDRDLLDVNLVGALRDVLGGNTLTVAIYRSVGDVGQERWLTRARLVGSEPVAQADPVWSEHDKLPLLADHPARLAVLCEARVIDEPEPGSATHMTRFPVVTDREVIGVLEIETDAPLHAPQQRLVGSILRVFRNFQVLLDYSERDSLTGLLNRKSFDESFMKATTATTAVGDGANERRTKDAGSYWIGIIDIDHFKRVNDQFGHLIGDEVLLLLSRLMRGSLRGWDRLYRFGGEEFVALLRCKDPASAAIAFERVRGNAERYAFPRVERVTVSIGFTEVRPGDTPSGAFQRADRAVYFVKANGRNQVRHYEALVESGDLIDHAAAASEVELF